MNKHTRRCCVLNCRNSNYKILSKTKTKLFKFPRNVNRCRDWVCAVGDPSVASCTWETLITHGYVCKDHFEEKYVTAIQGITVNAVPTIFPHLRTPLSEPQLRLFDESVPVQKSALGFQYYERDGSNVKDPTINQNPIMHNIVVEAESIIKLEEVNFELLKEAKVGSHVEEPIMIKNPIKDDIVVEAESIIKLEEVKEEPNDYVESSWTFLGEVQPPVPLMEPKEEVAEVKQEEEVEAQTSLPLLEPMEEVAEIKQEEEELDPPAAVFIKCGTGEIQAEGEGPLAPCNDDNSVDSPLQKARYLCPIDGVFKLAEEEKTTSGRTTSDKSTGSSSEDDDDDDHGSHDNQDDHDDEEEEEGASEDAVKKSVLARFGSRAHVACKSHYDPLVKRRVVELALSGECSVSAAARRCGVSERTAQGWMTLWLQTGDVRRRKGSGVWRISTPEEDALLLAVASRSNSFGRSTQLKKALAFPGCTGTIRRRLRAAGLGTGKGANWYPKLMDGQRVDRVAFALDNARRDWGRVVFSSACVFSAGEGGPVRVFRPQVTQHNAGYVPEPQRCGRASVACWGWMSARGVGVVQRVAAAPLAAQYLHILENVMLPSVRVLYPEEPFFFQQDQHRVHKTDFVQEWFASQQEFELLDWPPCSADLNPMEDVWAKTKQEMADKWPSPQPKNSDALWELVADAWDEVASKADFAAELVRSLPRRMRQVTENEGYWVAL